MRGIAAIAMIALLAASPALAQPASGRHGGAAKHARPHRSAGTPLDRGPFTPEANRAYQGGGVILQGAPGAPAPRPEATPPGQVPRNMVQPQ